ncbi:MAG: S41 family peptidase [Bacteroidales bacterium]|nr:S41 family peptidase [Bacteroidales bacterium]
MNIRRTIIAAVLTLGAAAVASAQSESFTLGKWVEIQNAILKELSRSYVDSLPVGRMERASVDAMLEELDPYTIYIPEEEDDDLMMMMNKSYGGVGAIIYKPEKEGNVVINEPYEGSPAARAGLVCGDEILAIDGKSVIGQEVKDCSDRMKGKPGTDVVLKVKKLRSGQTVDVKIRRERIHLPDLEYVGMLDDTTGYILQTGFTEKVSGEIREAVLSLKKQGMKRLVLDLRGNGGGLLQEAANIVSLFVPKGSLVVSVKGRAKGASSEYRTAFDPIDTKLPLIILVDSGTASASEIVAGALQDYDRAVIMGRRSFGKGLVQSIRPLPYNGKMKVTTAKYYIPSGRCVQAIDYAQRNEDGSVAYIPDSLTHEFHTAGGRIVKDGGGITPDVELTAKNFSMLTVSLVRNQIIEQYTLKYVREHESIAPAAEFKLTDADWEDFVQFAAGKEFDYRSGAKMYFDQVKKELAKEGLSEAAAEEIKAMDAVLEMDKVRFLNLKRDEIVPFIEEEIVVRYWYQAAGVLVRIRYDEQLREAQACGREVADWNGGR